MTNLAFCRNCGESLRQEAKGRRRHFCSPRCRQASYERRRRHRSDLRRVGRLLAWMQVEGYPAEAVGIVKRIAGEYGAGAAVASLELLDRDFR